MLYVVIDATVTLLDEQKQGSKKQVRFTKTMVNQSASGASTGKDNYRKTSATIEGRRRRLTNDSYHFYQQ